MLTFDLDWTALGSALRESADDAHNGDTLHVFSAYAIRSTPRNARRENSGNTGQRYGAKGRHRK